MAPPRRNLARRFNQWMDRTLGRRRIERERAESPSAEAQVFGPGTFAMLGNREMDGLLVVRNDLLARFADAENMNEYPELRATHEYFSQDSTQPDRSTGKTIWVTSPDDALKGMSMDLLHKRLRIEDKIYPISFGICMYGNHYEELMAIKDRGIVDIAQLPAPSMRRIEREDGVNIGFVQDVTMKISTDMSELLKRSRQADWPDHVAVFRNWQVGHWRYRPTSRMAPYGYGVTDGARWIWKRLVMMEDAMLIYKLCLRGDSQVWTTSGYKEIKDIEVGDEVYSYAKSGCLEKTKVTFKKCNGKDRVFKVRTYHRDLHANATHPVLVEWFENMGNGRRSRRHVEYVEVQNLIPGKHSMILPSVDDHHGEDVVIKLPDIHRKATLCAASVGSVERKMTYPNIAKEIGVHHYRARDFFSGEYELIEETAVALLEANGYGPEHLDCVDHWGGDVGPSVTGVEIPEIVTEDFARLFGFLLGDGSVAAGGVNKNGGYTGAKTGFALGDDESVNEDYRALFSSIVGEDNVRLDSDSRNRFGSYVFSSKMFAELMILNGFVPGAHNKRVPEWVYRAKKSIKIAFLKGFADADGAWSKESVSEIRKRKRHKRAVIELCNEALVNDLRVLAMQTGFSVSRVSHRNREGGHEIEPGRTMPPSKSWSFAFSIKNQKDRELILGVDEVDGEEIWDIGVEHHEHNFVADGVVVHNTRAPARYVWYVDIGNRPDDEAEGILRQAKMNLKKKKFVDPRTNQVNMRYNPLCLAGDTKVALLDGTEKTLAEMAKAYESGEEQWVYSVDVNDGNKVVPGKVVWAGQTRKNAEFIKITLDNGEEIKVTPDHKMIRRSGEFVEAQDLKAGDSLMPLRRRVSSKAKGEALDGYELVYCPKCQKSHYTHRMVARALLGKVTGDGSVIHHEKGKLNNDPRHLCLMGWEEHLRLHRELGFNGAKALHEKMAEDPEMMARWKAATGKAITKYNKSPEKRAKTSRQNRERDSAQYIRAYNDSPKHGEDNEIRKAKMHEHWSDPEKREVHVEALKIVFPTEFIEGLAALVRANPQANMDALASAVESAGVADLLRFANTRSLKHIHRNLLTQAVRGEGFKDFSSFKKFALADNHKVAKIEKCSELEDAWTLTVDDAHTFGLSAGVFVKNSNDEDVFLAMRNGQELTRVDILQGPDYQAIDDVEYMRKKMLSVLKVPREYLGEDGSIPGRAVLSNEDVRAARVSLGIQREIRTGFETLIRIDQAARGVPIALDLEFEVVMTAPSGIYALAAMEVANAEADYAMRIRDFVSKRFILKNVFHFSSSEIEAMEQERKAEASHEMAQQGGMFEGHQGQMLASLDHSEAPTMYRGSEKDRGTSPTQRQQRKVFDRFREEQDRKDRESERRHGEIMDAIGVMNANNARWSKKQAHARVAMTELKNGVLNGRRNGDVSALPASTRAVGSPFPRRG